MLRADSLNRRETPTITYTRSTLTDVYFNKSKLKNVKVIDCNWTDVTFVNCRLAGVTFSNVKMHSVRFYNVDFRRVQMIRATVMGVIWQDMVIRYWVSSPTILGIEPLESDSDGVPQWCCSTALSRTITSYRPASVQNRNERDVKALNGMDLCVIEPDPWEATTLLDLPRPILERIMSAIYHQDDVYMHERLVIKKPGVKLPGQTTYKLHSNSKSSSSARATYQAHLAQVDAKLSILSCLLYVNRACFDLAVKHIYDRRFCFYDNADSCIAFLHDHRREPYRISKLEIQYVPQTHSWRSYPWTLPASWRRLFNVLVHERPDLEQLVLKIHDDFWDVAPWRSNTDKDAATADYLKRRVDAVWAWIPENDYSWVEDRFGEVSCYCDQRLHFLQHVARLSGVAFNIRGCEGKDAPKAGFLNALRKHIQEKMDCRPRLAKARYGTCVERQLESCCYYKITSK